MDPQKNKLQVWTPLLFSLIMIFGMVLGFNLRDSLRNKRPIETVITRNDRLEQIIDLINEKYVDSVDANLLYEDAVSGILKHLDPHTVYIAPDKLQTVNEDLDGSFFGIGVEFSIVRDTIQVTSVVENGPAQRSGVDIGDQLIKVGDSIVAGTKISSERIIKMLRGKQHSKVLVTLLSQPDRKAKKIIIERDTIPIYSVEANIMLNKSIGYIRLNRFSATTFSEFERALDKIKKKGATSLILDLRQNPGGYLDAATAIADEFLNGDKLIVYTKGVHSPKKEYRTSDTGKFEKGRIVVLVDESSASASEILAGAIQDWDRGVIIGRRTYGKGLVQEQFEMDNGSALRLTIAKYYTPSGRCIQRSYSNGKTAYADDIAKRFEDGELTDHKMPPHLDTEKYYTVNKRVVYGGGGITPDIYVPYDTTKLNSGTISLVYGEKTKVILWDYFLKHRSELMKFKNVNDFNENFSTKDLLITFSKSSSQNIRHQLKLIKQKPLNYTYFIQQLKAQLARYLYRNNGYYSIEAKTDQAIQKAIQTLQSPKYLTIIKR